MICLRISKSKCCYSLVIVAVIVQMIITYFNHDDIRDPDIKSAVKRAKTEVCKSELTKFSLRSISGIESRLKRSCPLDTAKQRVVRICCASNKTDQLIALDEEISSTSDCLELCFSYGHSHAGYQTFSGKCYCGDGDYKNFCQEQSTCGSYEEFDYYEVNRGVYYSKRQSSVIDDKKSSNHHSSVRIAFLFTLSGSNSLQVQRILKNIYSELHFYYIHIDVRADHLFDDLLHLEETHDNVFLARTRLSTVWGSPNLLKVILNSFLDLSNYNWDYIINLSESDFPIKPLELLESYLSFDRNIIYLKEHNIKGYKFIRKQGLDRNFYQCEDRVWRVGRRRLPTGIVYSGGSDWFALPREFCQYILDNQDASDGLVQPLVKIYNHTLLPAESFFHTLAANSHFCDRITDSNLRITNWNRKHGCKCQHRDVVDWCGCSPLVYRSSDWGKIRKTLSSRDLFFSRKFDPTISSSIIGAVEQQLLRSFISNLGEYDTRHWQRVVFNHQAGDKVEGSLDSVLDQFGKYCLNQIKSFLKTQNFTSPKLTEVDYYFNRDRYVGLIVKYCEGTKCLNLLAKKNNGVHLRYHNSRCFEPDGRKLQALEVNHNFDTGERIFRNYGPLNHNSDIAVYHEWHIFNINVTRKDITKQLQFSWTNPSGGLELIQHVKFKNTTRPIRLTLAHRLNIANPLESGEWTLNIARKGLDCIKYNFLVFDPTSFSHAKIAQTRFDYFYSVSNYCLEEYDNETLVDDSCSNEEWSLVSRKRKQEEFD